MQSQANAESILKFILIVLKIWNYINCEDCEKHRYMYNEKSLIHEK